MNIFLPPEGLVSVVHITIPKVKVWAATNDQTFQEELRNLSGIKLGDGDQYEWFAFWIVIRLAKSFMRYKKWIPHVENVPKLIVDAFTGLLYPEKNIVYVKCTQVDADFSPNESELTEIWIYGKPKSE